jgi:hypothetical protein
MGIAKFFYRDNVNARDDTPPRFIDNKKASPHYKD